MLEIPNWIPGYMTNKTFVQRGHEYFVQNTEVKTHTPCTANKSAHLPWCSRPPLGGSAPRGPKVKSTPAPRSKTPPPAEIPAQSVLGGKVACEGRRVGWHSG